MTLTKLAAAAALVACSFVSAAQNVGLSFSYFLPRGGSFSTPISPFSFRGLGVNLTRHIALQTGGSLYRMSGLNMRGLPFQSKDALTGPNFTMFVPAELVIQFKGRRAEFDIKGGGFGFYALGQNINYGNMDRAIRARENWDVVNSDFSFKNRPGYGWMVGTELTVKMTRQFSISLETNYLSGMSAMPLKGGYTGGTLGGTNSTVAAEYKNAKVDFTGLEFSIGVIFTGR